MGSLHRLRFIPAPAGVSGCSSPKMAGDMGFILAWAGSAEGIPIAVKSVAPPLLFLSACCFTSPPGRGFMGHAPMWG